MNAAGHRLFRHFERRAGDIVAWRLVGTTADPGRGPRARQGPNDNNAGTTDQAISVDAAGNAVAAWDEQDGGNTEIYARRLNGITQGAITERDG